MAARVFASALVTGASSGIGAALARALPATTRLLVTGRDRDRLAALAAGLDAAGHEVEALAADLATDAGRAAVITRAEARAIDLLVNNAGFGRFGPYLESDPRVEREMVEVNVTAVAALTRALLPGMIARARGGGTRAGLIVVASTVAFAPAPFFATYAATKAFDLHFSEALAVELADEPIDVLALCPGATRTEFQRRAGMGGGARPRGHTAEEVAARALAALGKKPVLVVGARNRLAAFAARLLPRAAMARLSGRVLWRRYRPGG
ncbi:MAG: SDR family NAD(P)-dependent oxidoreductase [Proteobacteria bacterium]|nr:SDR family NAD(P)-dependent oxidoreductase [Pseudomonadota bacterium]